MKDNACDFLNFNISHCILQISIAALLRYFSAVGKNNTSAVLRKLEKRHKTSSHFMGTHMSELMIRNLKTIGQKNITRLRT